MVVVQVAVVATDRCTRVCNDHAACAQLQGPSEKRLHCGQEYLAVPAE
jgi:hypothetical protein